MDDESHLSFSEYLLALHRRGSLAAAAKELGVTKATISRRLAALEEAARAQLFERTPNGVVITAAGRAVVSAAEEMEQATASLDARLAAVNDAQPRGTVRFTAPAFIAERFVIPYLPELKQRYPELELQLVGSNRLLNIAQREADLALRNVRPNQQSLTLRKVLSLAGCVYASQPYLQRKGVPRDREALRGHDLLVYEGLGGMPGFEWMHEPPPGAAIAFRANDPESLVSASAAGLGLCAVPCLIGDARAALVRVETLGIGRCDLFLVCPDELKQAPRVRATSDFVTELLSRHRTEIDPFAA